MQTPRLLLYSYHILYPISADYGNRVKFYGNCITVKFNKSLIFVRSNAGNKKRVSMKKTQGNLQQPDKNKGVSSQKEAKGKGGKVKKTDDMASGMGNSGRASGL